MDAVCTENKVAHAFHAAKFFEILISTIVDSTRIYAAKRRLKTHSNFYYCRFVVDTVDIDGLKTHSNF